jgi:hypothetical protein
MRKYLYSVLLLSLFSINSNGQTLLERNNAQQKSANIKVPPSLKVNVDSLFDLSASGPSTVERVQMPVIFVGRGRNLSESIEQLNRTNEISLEAISRLNSKIDSVQNSRLSLQQKLDSLRKLNEALNLQLNEQSLRITQLQKNADSLAAYNAVILHKSLLPSLVDLDSTNRANVENLQYSLLQTIELVDKYYLKVDTTKFIENRSDFLDSAADIKVRAIILNEKRIELQNTLKTNKLRLLAIVAEFSKQHPDTSETSKTATLLDEQKLVATEIVKLQAKLRSYLEVWNKLVEKYVKVKEVEKSKKIDVSALPFISALSEFKDINANLNIIGSNIPVNKDGLYTELGLYTRIFNSSDSASPYNYFISDMGNYGIFIKSNIGFKATANEKYDQLGVNLNIAYSNKPVTKDTIKGIVNNFNSSLFHARVGFEVTIFKNIFSSYVNANALAFVTNNEAVQTKYGYSKDILGFCDWGLRMLLNPTDEKTAGKFKLYVDLNFIVNSKNVQLFNPAEKSALIPNFRIGLRTNLGAL